MITGILAVAIFLFTNQSKACTNYIITKGASTDGSVLVSYAADSHTLYGELYHWKAQKYAEGSMLDVYEWDTGKYLGKIKQVKQTYNVVGNMNEYQVAIGETTYGGREELHSQEGAIVDYGSLIYIALQRSKNAREAMKIMTDLVAEYGYYSSGESFSITDKNEAWILEMIGKGNGEKGAVWVAVKIPDGYISGHANQARITTFNYQANNDWFNENATTFNSVDVITFAKKKGWFEGDDKIFSFSDTYAPVDFGAARFSEIRVYSMFHKVSKEISGNANYFEYVKGNVKYDGTKNNYATNRMPLYIKPDRKISAWDVMVFMGDHLEGTDLDMSKDIGAGPYGNPYRWRPLTFKVGENSYVNERATATQQTGFVFVAQSRSWLPDAIGGILWFAVDDAASTVFMPMYCSITQVPSKMATGYGSMMEFKPDAAFWVFNQVSNLAYTRYSEIHPEIAAKMAEKNAQFNKQVAEVDAKAKELYAKRPKKAVAYLTNYSTTTGNSTVDEWQQFYYFLFTKYMDGNIKTKQEVPEGYKYYAPKVNQPGYPESWRKKIADETGDKLKMPATK